MINVVDRKCEDEACNKRPTFGEPGQKRARYCAEHSSEGMVDVVNKKCTFDGCVKHPFYGMPGSNKVCGVSVPCVACRVLLRVVTRLFRVGGYIRVILIRCEGVYIIYP